MKKGVAADVLIGTVERTRREEVRVSVRRANGVKWLDLRIYYESEDGTMRPSPRGVSLSPTEWSQLRGILQRLKRDGRDEAVTSPPAVQP